MENVITFDRYLICQWSIKCMFTMFGNIDTEPIVISKELKIFHRHQTAQILPNINKLVVLVWIKLKSELLGALLSFYPLYWFGKYSCNILLSFSYVSVFACFVNMLAFYAWIQFSDVRNIVCFWPDCCL